MKKLIVCLFVLFTLPVFGQSTQPHILNDSSLCFIEQVTGGNVVELSADELALAEQLLLQAFEEFNIAQQQYADSVNPKRKKRRSQGFRLRADNYKFCLIPVIKGREKEIWITGNCKGRFNSRKRKDTTGNKDWEKKFIDPDIVSDGGTCFIRVAINLTLKTHGQLIINGMA